ncbi:hypothetical protein BDD12DRAFT_752847 [Trichophaea hybrida]|nr:hypothetical protein BDD12DRAFT_752847 [Trichophaea hybrida]
MVKRNGWPEQTQGQVKADTVGTACCFMVFGNVDIYETVPPSPVVGWRAHCAEVIVKAHLCQIRNAAAVVTPEPFKHTQTATTSTERSNNIPQNPVFLAIPELQPYAALHGDPDSRTNPSSFLPISAAYEAILCADYAMHMIHRRKPEVVTYAEKIVVKSIAKLVDIGPPSWGGAAASIKEWPDIIGDAYRNVMQELAGENSVLNRDMEDLLEYAHLYSLRASYYTVIVGASGEVGPAFTNQAVPVTALAYMV